MLRFLCVFLLLFSVSEAYAQLYRSEKTQHRFAQTYVGFNTQFAPASGKLYAGEESTPFPAMAFPRLSIGGLHFWGHVDFTMNFALASLGDFQLKDGSTLSYGAMGDLGVRLYPWAVRFGGLRPYAGFMLTPIQIGLEDTPLGSRYDGFTAGDGLLGFSFATKKGWQFHAEAQVAVKKRYNFYTSPSQRETFHLPRTFFSVGLVKYFDVTLREERGKFTGEYKKIEKELIEKKKLNSFSLAIAPSSSHFFHSPRYSEAHRQAVPRLKGDFNWDIGLGYLFHKAKWHVGLSYRSSQGGTEAYGVEHVIRRESLAFEAFKFLLDYNGFVPYLGPSISYERWATGEFIHDEQAGEIQRTRMFSPGIIFGWDIVPSPLEFWLLRTNLRYYPMQEIKDLNGKSSRVDQFEFNFIQFVFYPNRIFLVKRKKASRKI